MQEDTRRLLQECNSGCKMAINSMTQIQKFVTDTGLEQLIRESKEKHEGFEAESAKLLEENGEKEKEPTLMAAAFSKLSTETKMRLNKGNKEVAKIMTDGCNMGMQSLAGKLNEFRNAAPESRNLAERIIKEEEDFMRRLQAYL